MTSIYEKIVHLSDSEIQLTHQKLDHLERYLYNSYEPSLPPNPDFIQRLQSWLENFAGNLEDAKVMFQSIPQLFFIGPEEFRELYQFTYNGPIARWLIDKYNIQLDDPDATNKLKQAAQETWFCPISDSLRINQFYHVNNVSSGADHRPDWRSLAKFSNAVESIKGIKDECVDNGIKNIVLLEDFVGGGSQISEIFQFLSNFTSNLNILITPLMICPNGDLKTKVDLKNYDIDYSPGLVLNHRAFVFPTRIAEEQDECELIRAIANSTYQQVKGTTSHGNKPYAPFGYNDTGGLVVMYSNTPDNTLPMYHHPSDSWEPLFPRHSRV